MFEGLRNFWNGITGVTAANNAADAQRLGISNAQNYLGQAAGAYDPYAAAGQNALQAQQNLLGLGGADAQADVVSGIQSSPLFQSLVAQGENSLLQNAAATGGLRGGNTSAALAQFAPQMLNQQIMQQYQNLGGLSNMGFGAAQGQAGVYGQQAGLAQSLGNVNASNQLANYNLQRGFVGDIANFGLNLGSTLMGLPPMAGITGGNPTMAPSATGRPFGSPGVF